MDILSLDKANKALKNIKHLDEKIVEVKAESRFNTVDKRLNWLEIQRELIFPKRTVEIDFSEGVFTNTELINGKIQLANLEEV